MPPPSSSSQMMKKEFECEEDHKIVDQRLILCTVACAFSIFGVVYDYLFPFPSSCVVLAICSIRYPLLMMIVECFSLLAISLSFPPPLPFSFSLSRFVLNFLLDSFPTYFILMGVITVFSLYHEGHIFMVALERNVTRVVSGLLPA